MTDTRILDAMMKMLDRNPLEPHRLQNPDEQFIETDERPFYATREPIAKKDMNRRYAERVDLFHEDVKGARLERPRRGTCRECGGEVHAVETKIKGAVRVDGKCLSCGWELHRAGLLSEKG